MKLPSKLAPPLWERSCAGLAHRSLVRLFVFLLILGNGSCASTTRGLRLDSGGIHATTRQALKEMKHERRVALVIGNGAYTGVGPLKNPPNDAELMGRTLRSLGFAVTVVKNADRPRISRELDEFERRLADAEVGLFYFAGHGVQRGSHNYLVPTAPAIVSAQDFGDHALRLGAIMDAMRRAGTRMNIVILDACRNDPFPQDTRSAGAGLGDPENAAGTVIAYAAAKGRAARDGAGDHSPYTRALAVQMRKPNVEIGTMLRNVFAAVDEETGGAQQPWYEVAVKGQFYFNLGEDAPPDLDPTLLERHNNVPAIVAGGAGIAGLAGGLIFGSMALRKERQLARACGNQDTCPTKYEDLEEDRNLYRSLAWVGAGVGAVGLGGLWWLLSHDGPERPRQRAALRWSIGATFVGVGGEF